MMRAMRRSTAVLGRSAMRSSFSRPMARMMSTDEYEFELKVEPETHLVDTPEIKTAKATKDEMMHYHKEMFRIRRMEITFDKEYKERNIRGFCHLYDGQEAVALGLQTGLGKDDDLVGTYRCHALQLVRGDTVERVAAELFGNSGGVSAGKGGSMHLYSKKNRFWGGAGIVGAQVPVGAGLAFAQKYLAKEGQDMGVTVAMFGDGAANQGQIWEAANMSKLWGLPLMLFCENNQYGMGTSVDRHSCNPEYYKQGGVAIPGIKLDGMDVLAMRDGMRWCKEYAGKGNGPLFVECRTYRYHGHSMSDPGVTYRDREEINEMRKTKDCIELVKSRIMEAGWASAEELKAIEKGIRKEVDAEIEAAKKHPLPDEAELYTDIFYNEVPAFIRGAEKTTSRVRQ